MSDELKPVRCGCGGEAEIIKHPNGKYTVSCTRGGCMANIGWCPDEKTAIEAWNKAMGAKDINVPGKERTAKAKVNYKDENYFFGWCECGQYQNSQFPYCPVCGARLEWDE